MTNAVILTVDEYNQLKEKADKAGEYRKYYEDATETHYKELVDMINDTIENKGYLLIASDEKLGGVLDRMKSYKYIYKLVKE